MIVLAWPPKELHPNARTHFRVKAPITKAYREAAYWLTKQRALQIDKRGPVRLSLVFFPPDKRRRDLDGMFSSMKAALDGISDALGVDDQLFEFKLSRSLPCKGGKVWVFIDGVSL